jgi:hypothetical protein
MKNKKNLIENVSMSINLTMKRYSERSFVVRGTIEMCKTKLDRLGGKYNARLRGGPGWIFANTKSDAVERYINNSSGTKAEPKELLLQKIVAECEKIKAAQVTIQELTSQLLEIDMSFESEEEKVDEEIPPTPRKEKAKSKGNRTSRGPSKQTGYTKRSENHAIIDHDDEPEPPKRLMRRKKS